MRDFVELSPRGQVARLRQLALAALERYDVRVQRLSLLQHYLNTTFMVEVGDGSHTEPVRKRLVLRVHRPGYHHEAAVASELEWLSALRRDVHLAVPEPVPTRDGALLTVASASGVPELRTCVLFHWLEGRMLRPPRGLGTLERIGRFIGEIHHHAETFRRSPGFTRARWDLDGLSGRAVGVEPRRARAALHAEELTLCERALRNTGAAIRELGEPREVFGLIHSDLFWKNVLLHRGCPRVIDFDGCGFGYYAYDLAVALSDERHTPRQAGARAALLRGYRSVRRLSSEEEELLDVFIAARLTVHSLWVAANASSPTLAAQRNRFMSEQMTKLRRLL